MFQAWQVANIIILQVNIPKKTLYKSYQLVVLTSEIRLRKKLHIGVFMQGKCELFTWKSFKCLNLTISSAYSKYTFLWYLIYIFITIVHTVKTFIYRWLSWSYEIRQCLVRPTNTLYKYTYKTSIVPLSW